MSHEIKKYLVLYCEDWNTNLITSKHHFIERLAKENNEILYLEVPFNIFSYISKPSEYFNRNHLNLFRGLRKVKENIWVLKLFVPIPYHPILGVITDNLFVNFINQKFILIFLKLYLKRINFFNYEAIVYYPMIYPVIKSLKFDKIHFHIVDDWQGFKGIPKTMLQLTKKLASHADSVIVSSSNLMKKYKKYNKNIKLLRHGTDPEIFNQGVNLAIKSKENVKVGYYGSLEKLDFKLIKKVSIILSSWNFYFLGPLTPSVKKEIKYIKRDNVTFLNPIQRKKLPSFLKTINVFFMPFKINQLNKSMTPIKVYEVLNFGLPIVSVDLDEIKFITKKYILFSNDKEIIIKNLIKAVQTDSIEKKKKRIQFVKPYSWDNRFKIFKKIIN